MPCLRKRAQTQESPTNSTHQTQNDQAQNTETQKVSLYEQSREERIKENHERMMKLGILDLSLKLNSAISNKRTARTRTTTPRSSSAPQSGPVRRSSRLQNVTPVSYMEVNMVKKGKSLKDEDILLEEGSKPEIYTEEHEKLLGNTEKTWTLFVDGYGKDGKRIYDPFRGKTCHQCRQKTLGHRTQCSKCNMVQGQFCGDCLYMRYGEHVLEAAQNPNWTCPVCRGICNCSLCRQGKGWPPTGPLYRKISKLGFKSVAHYLIQARGLQTNLDENADAIKQASVKRSLPFSESGEHSSNLQAEAKCQDEFKDQKESEMQDSPNPASNKPISVRRSLPFSDIGVQAGDLNPSAVDHDVDGLLELPNPHSEDKTDDQFTGEKEKEPHFTDQGNTGIESDQNVKKRALTICQSPDSIAGRLRSRRKIT